ncbi:hypothetical protein [Hymenobacter sp. BT491]|uniref:hypothetical protein n=1 Tax=Hymenobacter sp. BT491 TaxID=2766779 RepID=UPI001653705D|nr:hypothetical protein [Hymenobacter sp. BT491]MBC6988929.1 hypothetical protein [Hymenobacter sp. BT491]
MPRQELFTLRYSAQNRAVLVYYDPDARTVGNEEYPLDTDAVVRHGAATPDGGWTYQDGALAPLFCEGTDGIQLAYIRTAPFATVTVVPNASACALPTSVNDLTYHNLVISGLTVSFDLTGSHPPFETRVGEGGAWTVGKLSYTLPTAGVYLFQARDADGWVAGLTTPVGDTLPPPEPHLVLLKRRNKQLPSPDGSEPGISFEWYYDPETRTAFMQTVFEESFFPYVMSLPTTTVVSSWCLETGAAPFTQRQVYHDGNGGITFVDEDGVLACQIVCTIGLSLNVTPAGLNGTGSITATVSGAQGSFLLYLNDSATGQSDLTFVDVPPGAGKVTVRETRANGCSASQSFLISTAYGVRYRHTADDTLGRRYDVLFKERGYTGPEEAVCGVGSPPVTLDWAGKGSEHVMDGLLRGSECDLQLLLEREDQMLDTFSGDERLYQVEVRREDIGLLWRGYLLPEQWELPMVGVNRQFQLHATDGLGSLQDMPFTSPTGTLYAGEWTVLKVIQTCLQQLDLDLPLHVLCNVYPEGATAAACALAQVLVDVTQYRDDKGKPFSCGKILTFHLETLQARLYQWGGAFWLDRIADLSLTSQPYWAFAPDGTALGTVNGPSLYTVGLPQDRNLFWLTAAQRMRLLGAVQNVTATVDPGSLANLLTNALPATGATTLPSGWSGTTTADIVYQGPTKTPPILLPGAAVGASIQALGYVQLPPSQPVPLVSSVPGQVGSVTLRFTVTPRTNAISQDPALVPELYVAVRYAGKWLSPFGFPTTDDPLVTHWLVSLPKPDSAIDVELRGYRADDKPGLHPVEIRFYQPLTPQGAPGQPCDVEITNLVASWDDNSSTYVESDYTREVTEDNPGVRVSRTDDRLDLFHADTPHARNQGTLLRPDGFPTTRWKTLSNPATLLELSNYAVLNRLQWQAAPIQTYTGVLQGDVSPGGLLTAPYELMPGVFLLTSASLDVKATRWTITAAQLRTLKAPNQPDVLPQGVLYTEDDRALLTEAGHYMIVEDAR